MLFALSGIHGDSTTRQDQKVRRWILLKFFSIIAFRSMSITIDYNAIENEWVVVFTLPKPSRTILLIITNRLFTDDIVEDHELNEYITSNLSSEMWFTSGKIASQSSTVWYGIIHWTWLTRFSAVYFVCFHNDSRDESVIEDDVEDEQDPPLFRSDISFVCAELVHGEIIADHWVNGFRSKKDSSDMFYTGNERLSSSERVEHRVPSDEAAPEFYPNTTFTRNRSHQRRRTRW